MKKLFALLLAICMLVGMVSFATAEADEYIAGYIAKNTVERYASLIERYKKTSK